jgi:hypothetical protein
MAHELGKSGFDFDRQLPLPVISHLRLGGFRLGYLLMKDGIFRIANGL